MRTAFVAALLLLTAVPGCAPRAAQTPILMLAAASTIDAVEAASAAFQADTGLIAQTSFGATSMLARQLIEGAPAGLMLAASSEWADRVAQRIAITSRVTIASNRIVVVAPTRAESAPATLEGIVADGVFRRLAIADTESVPAGIYAREALVMVGLWAAIEPRLIPTVDVRAALRLAERGEVDAAFVYRSDAHSSDHIRAIHAVDPALHGTIEYPLLLLAGATAQEALFFEFLASEDGRAFFLNAGFSAPPY